MATLASERLQGAVCSIPVPPASEEDAGQSVAITLINMSLYLSKLERTSVDMPFKSILTGRSPFFSTKAEAQRNITNCVHYFLLLSQQV